MNEQISERTKRTSWMMNDRFGLFIHFGLYAIPARGEWIRSWEKISNEQYQQYFDEFNPVDYDPVQWAKAAKKAGMKYAVMTAKHHDGFCLFDSKLTDYKATSTKAGRDLIAEYVQAFRAEGLKVGLYYSLIDWHHPDYPHFGDQFHPMKDNEAYKDIAHNFDRYLTYMHGQIKELCTNYGKIDVMWFDFSYGNMSGEKWKAKALVEMIRTYQPEVILDNRLEAEEKTTIHTANPTIYSGDFTSPEQIIPPEGILDDAGNALPWETCLCMNDNWGYCGLDTNYKPTKLIIRKMVECCAKGGNVLLNVGPDAKGNFPQPCLEMMEQIGAWMQKNAESISGCGIAGITKPDWGWYTKRGNIIYAHIFEESMGFIGLKIPYKIKKMRLLHDKTEIKAKTGFNTLRWPEYTFLSFGAYSKPGHFYSKLPCDIDTVIEIEVEE